MMSTINWLSLDHFAYHIREFGWIGEDQVSYVQKGSGETQHFISPVEVADSQTKLVQKPTTANISINAEVHSAQGADFNACPQFTGVLLYQIDRRIEDTAAEEAKSC